MKNSSLVRFPDYIPDFTEKASSAIVKMSPNEWGNLWLKVLPNMENPGHFPEAFYPELEHLAKNQPIPLSETLAAFPEKIWETDPALPMAWETFRQTGRQLYWRSKLSHEPEAWTEIFVSGLKKLKKFSYLGRETPDPSVFQDKFSSWWADIQFTGPFALPSDLQMISAFYKNYIGPFGDVFPSEVWHHLLRRLSLQPEWNKAYSPAAREALHYAVPKSPFLHQWWKWEQEEGQSLSVVEKNLRSRILLLYLLNQSPSLSLRRQFLDQMGDFDLPANTEDFITGSLQKFTRYLASCQNNQELRSVEAVFSFFAQNLKTRRWLAEEQNLPRPETASIQRNALWAATYASAQAFPQNSALTLLRRTWTYLKPSSVEVSPSLEEKDFALLPANAKITQRLAERFFHQKPPKRTRNALRPLKTPIPPRIQGLWQLHALHQQILGSTSGSWETLEWSAREFSIEGWDQDDIDALQLIQKNIGEEGNAFGLVPLPQLLQTSLELHKNASAIATETTRNTLEKMPGYHKTIGEEGSNLCKRDFTYTLQEIAKQLIYGREQVGENLLQWWNESIGQYLANRPKDLFTISLESLQDALLSGLSNEPYDLTLEIVQQLFRDAMGTPFSPRRFFFQAPSPHQSPEYSGVKNEKTLRSFFRNLRDRIPEDDLTKIKEFIEGEAEIQEIIIAADNPRSLILAFGESLTCDESHLTQGLLSSLLAYSRYQFAAALLSCLADEDSRAGQELFNWVKQWGAYTDMEWFTWEGLRFLAEVLLPLYESNELENLLRRALKRAEEEKETVFWSRPFFQFLLAGLESLKPYETLIRLTLTSEKPVFSQDPTEEKALRGLFALSLLGSHLKLVRPKFADQILTQKFAALPLTKEVWSKSSEIFHTHLDRLFHELDGKGFYEAMETIKSLPSQKPEKLRFSFKGTPTKEVRNYLSEVKPKGVPHAIRSLLGCNTSDPSQLLWYAALYLSSAVSHETLPAEEMYPLLQWIQNELPQGEWDDFKKKTLTGGYTLPKLIENIESDPQHAAESAFAR